MSRLPNEDRTVIIRADEIITQGGAPLDLGNEIKLYNPNQPANFTDLKYTGTTDKEVDLKYIETQEGGTSDVPAIPLTSDTGGYFVTVSSRNPNTTIHSIYDDTINPNQPPAVQFWSSYELNAIFLTADIFDTNTGVYVSGNSTGGILGAWHQLQLPSALNISSYTISRIRYNNLTGADGLRFAPSSWKLLISNDETNWTEIHEKIDEDWGDGVSVGTETQKTYTTTDNTTTGTFLRFVFTKNSFGYNSTGRGAVWVNEISLVSPTVCPNGCLQTSAELEVDNNATITGGVNIAGNVDIGSDISANNAIFTSINTLSPIGGKFSQTESKTATALIGGEVFIISGAGVGSLTFPAGSIKVGDSYHMSVSGTKTNGNNQNLTLQLVSNGNILLSTGGILLSNITNEPFSLEIDFTVITTGGLGVASVQASGAYRYIDATAWSGWSFNALNNTTVDTTIENVVTLTAEMSGATDSITVNSFVLTKTF